MVLMLIGLSGCSREPEDFYGVKIGSSDRVSIPNYAFDSTLDRWSFAGDRYSRESYKKIITEEDDELYRYAWQYDLMTPQLEVMKLNDIVSGVIVKLYLKSSDIDQFIDKMAKNLGKPISDSRKNSDQKDLSPYPTVKFSKNWTLYDVTIKPHYRTDTWGDDYFIEYRITARTKALVQYQD